MAFQFVHLESWSRRPDNKGRSTTFVFDEAVRKPSASLHVQNPKPPATIYGVGVEEVRAMHDAAAAVAMTPGARGKLRKIQVSQKTLHSVVASHPYTVEEVRADKTKQDEVRQWERLTIEWLKRQYGPALKSVIRHTDETHWHVHAFVVNSRDPELKAIGYHPGVVVKRAVKAAGRRPGEDGKTLNKRADMAYQGAMREWQDSYHESVAVPCGLTRLGPKRRRLTRAEWHAEQAQAKALKRAVERAAAVDAKGREYIDRTRAEAHAVKADAAKVRAAVNRLTGVGGAFRAVIDGIQESRIREQVRKEFARDLAVAKAAAEKAEAETARAKSSRLEYEKKAADANYALRQQQQRLAAAQREIRNLSRALAAAVDEPTPTPGGMTP
ncbi:hypothetical protein AB9E14_07570 [Rhizobium leguminosarum]|uniref:hypothetical protein n=1 Tax=Rhizobium leguminosarum TaxID=384 RepID=UPI003F99409C|nr:hypothetical protein [Rhizobium leguminosarum]